MFLFVLDDYLKAKQYAIRAETTSNLETSAVSDLEDLEISGRRRSGRNDRNNRKRKIVERRESTSSISSSGGESPLFQPPAVSFSSLIASGKSLYFILPSKSYI